MTDKSKFEDVVDTAHDAITCTYFSMAELADAAKRRDNGGNATAMGDRSPDPFGPKSDWFGATFDEALNLARQGWEEHLTETLAIAESAIDMVEKQHEVTTFQPVWDVAGAEVDVARYLSGEPENMIDFPSAPVSKLGKVITLCASVSYSSAIKPDTIVRRGQVIAAFAILLTRLGYSAELWIDVTAGRGAGSFSLKTMVKGPNDVTDPAKILYAYAHPSTLRRLVFAVENSTPKTWWNKALAAGRGRPESPVKSLPDGTIYLPELLSGHDVPDAHEALKDLLREADLLAG